MAAQSILIADGDSDSLAALQQALQEHGYTVETAGTSLEALQRLAHRNFDLVIASGEMPDMDGLELCERIRTTISPDLTAILVAAEIQLEQALQAVRLGIGDMLQRPVHPDELLRSVRKRLARPMLQDSLLHDKLACYSLTYSFSAAELARQGLVERIVGSFIRMGDIPSMAASTLQLCLDEMLHNAFIHGTLQLQRHHRDLDGEPFQRLVEGLLQNEEVQRRTVRVELEHCREKGKITVQVHDMGQGFNPDPYLQCDCPDLQDTTGRGLRFLQVLTEEVRFENDGRSVYIKLGYDNS